MTLKSKLAKGATYLALATAILTPQYSTQARDNPNEKSVEELREDIQRHFGYSKVPGFKAKAGFDLYLKTPDKSVEALVEQSAKNIPYALRESAGCVSIDPNQSSMGGSTGGNMIELNSTNDLSGKLPHELGHAWLASKSESERKEILNEWNSIAQFNYSGQNTVNGKTWKDSDPSKIKSLYAEIMQEKENIRSEKAALTKLYEGAFSRSDASEIEYFEKRNSAFEDLIAKHNQRVEKYNSLRHEAVSPKYGLVSPYAATSPQEDMAETIRYLVNESPKAKELTQNPDPRYSQKMQYLAKKVGFNLEDYIK